MTSWVRLCLYRYVKSLCWKRFATWLKLADFFPLWELCFLRVLCGMATGLDQLYKLFAYCWCSAIILFPVMSPPETWFKKITVLVVNRKKSQCSWMLIADIPRQWCLLWMLVWSCTVEWYLHCSVHFTGHNSLFLAHSGPAFQCAAGMSGPRASLVASVSMCDIFYECITFFPSWNSGHHMEHSQEASHPDFPGFGNLLGHMPFNHTLVWHYPLLPCCLSFLFCSPISNDSKM